LGHRFRQLPGFVPPSLQQRLVVVQNLHQPGAEQGLLAGHGQRALGVLLHPALRLADDVLRLQLRLGQYGLGVLLGRVLGLSGGLPGEGQGLINLHLGLRILLQPRLQPAVLLLQLLVFVIEGLVGSDHFLHELVHVGFVVPAPGGAKLNDRDVPRFQQAHGRPSVPGEPPTVRRTATVILPLRVGPASSWTTASPRPSRAMTSPSRTVAAGSGSTRPLTATRSALTSRAMRVRDRPKPRLPTASSRGDATVPLTTFSRGVSSIRRTTSAAECSSPACAGGAARRRPGWAKCPRRPAAAAGRETGSETDP